MTTTRILASSKEFVTQFSRCCGQYQNLNIAVAWCGNPKKVLPFQLIQPLGSNITALVGVSFLHTHPDAIKWFMDVDADIRIFKDVGATFHPKIYLFRSQRHFALFIGSSNFTHHGFSLNDETNCLIEGPLTRRTANHAENMLSVIENWRTDKFSFHPTTAWLRGYRSRYSTATKNQLEQGLPTPPGSDDKTPTENWIRFADWNLYYDRVVAKLARHGNGRGHHSVLDAAAKNLPLPWTRQIFASIENRRIIGGMPPYGWFGNVAASGRFRSIMANGTQQEHATMVRSMNAIAGLQLPLPEARLRRRLNALVALGPSMKVWSRLLCLLRPDLYCTIASRSTRSSLSKAFDIPQHQLVGVDGYLNLLDGIHACPWFNSAEPAVAAELAIWRRRTAFLDPIVYR